jgi:Kelch motif protein/galactose oxidase-like protein
VLWFALAAALLIAPATAAAVNTVGFTPAGNMTTARDFPGAASLPDGRVLIVGGGLTTFFDPQTSAEIFDPKTNTFSAAGVGSMAVPRYGPATAALPDGRILVAGGYDGNDDVASAEVFDPKSGTFSNVGSMAAAREGAATALLPDGRLLVAGGASNESLDSSEIFDPKTNTFSPGPNLPQGVDAPASAPISQGRTLIAGGYTTDYSTGSVVFTPPATFTSAGSIAVKAYGPAGAALPQGRALVAGGYDGTPSGYLDNAEIFDPQTNAFSSAGVGKLLDSREEAAGAALPDGRALVAGGFDEKGALSTAELLSVPSSSFKSKLKGRKVKFTVSTEGTAQTTDVSTKVATTAKKKKPKLVKTVSKHGGPGTITVKIKLTKQGSAKLSQKGKLKVRVTYTPDGGLGSTKKLKLRAGKPSK